MSTILRTKVLSEFTCLCDRCEDTCCQNWSMQVDNATLERYHKEAPALLEAVEPSLEAPWIMRKDPATGFCVKLDNGFCGIHKAYGDKFLGDACYFYPRVTRTLGEQVVMTATMSCPEIVRLALTTDKPCSMEKIQADRLPHTINNYLSDNEQSADALVIHQAFLDATDDQSASAEQIFLRIASTSRSLERIDRKSWLPMAAFYLKNADIRIPPPAIEVADPFNLLHALCGLIVASHKPPSVRLKQTIADMEKGLSAKLDWEKVQIHTDENSLPAYRKLQELWRKEASAHYTPYLRRWLQMQMSLALYPFSGLGSTLSDRVTIIGVRLATVKLALLCGHRVNGGLLSQDTVVRIIQSLSRFMDHLGDPAYSLKVYGETGWIREPRMRGLLEQ